MVASAPEPMASQAQPTWGQGEEEGSVQAGQESNQLEFATMEVSSSERQDGLCLSLLGPLLGKNPGKKPSDLIWLIDHLCLQQVEQLVRKAMPVEACPSQAGGLGLLFIGVLGRVGFFAGY